MGFSVRSYTDAAWEEKPEVPSGAGTPQNLGLEGGVGQNQNPNKRKFAVFGWRKAAGRLLLGSRSEPRGETRWP